MYLGEHVLCNLTCALADNSLYVSESHCTGLYLLGLGG